MTSSNRGEREAGIAQDRNKWSKVRTLPVSLSGNGAAHTSQSASFIFSVNEFSHTLHFMVSHAACKTQQDYQTQLENSSPLGCDAASDASKKGVAFILKGSRSMNPRLRRCGSPKTRKPNYVLCMSVHNANHPPNVLPSKYRKFLSAYEVTYTWVITPKFYPVKYLHRSNTLEGKLFVYFRLMGL